MKNNSSNPAGRAGRLGSLLLLAGLASILAACQDDTNAAQTAPPVKAASLATPAAAAATVALSPRTQAYRGPGPVSYRNDPSIANWCDSGSLSKNVAETADLVVFASGINDATHLQVAGQAETALAEVKQRFAIPAATVGLAGVKLHVCADGRRNGSGKSLSDSSNLGIAVIADNGHGNLDADIARPNRYTRRLKAALVQSLLNAQVNGTAAPVNQFSQSPDWYSFGIARWVAGTEFAGPMNASVLSTYLDSANLNVFNLAPGQLNGYVDGPKSAMLLARYLFSPTLQGGLAHDLADSTQKLAALQKQGLSFETAFAQVFRRNGQPLSYASLRTNAWTWIKAEKYGYGGPESGWWWNPAEGGRGFMLERQGDQIFMAGFLYEDDGRATWFVSQCKLSAAGDCDGSIDRYRGGQSLTGSYKTPTSTRQGQLRLQFNSPDHGTLTWPGGVVAIERFPVVADGVKQASLANWWWNPAEGGRGFAIEFQGDKAFIATFTYEADGEPVWFLADGTLTDSDGATVFRGRWQRYANGQSMRGAFRSPTVTEPNVGSLVMSFRSTEQASLTLPDGRVIALEPFRF
ncbi:hypothetical protein FNU76_13375 [Chitinimonas arctica]|uniref:Uncharacterized protein n=1 Tax=Chitinimonas arctica TaxID=2594795 RepID=A0A516SGJ1_9NEIS|nr:hypothetical protein [Chitinimonas arctica]QDQ27275.1 hypothetical protein FNU76_13375 [Chitinimonas arctica]